METPGPSIYLILLLLIGASAFFSASETALTSVNRIRIKNQAEEGNRKARTVLRLSDDFDGTLSTILIGNNVVNNAAASIATVVATSLMGASGAAVATVVITVLILIFGEILPKSFAKEWAERVALAVSGVLRVLKILLSPLVWLFVQLKRLFTGRRSNELNVQPSVTQEELKTIIDTVEEEGVLDSQETEIIQSAIDFDATTVQDILVPRVDMAAVPLNAPATEALDVCVRQGYSRVPLYQGSIDHIVGVVHAKDMLACLAQGRPVDLAALRRDVLFVYRTKRINELLAELRRSNQHLAIVTDEHGGTLGLVTMEDILEELVGEIWDETDRAQTLIQPLSATTWRVDGDVHVEDLFEAIGLNERQVEDGDYTTAAGWALEMLHHIPVAGEQFTAYGFTVTIDAMEEQRIAYLTMARVPAQEPAQEE